jgi:hypothetical protein
MTPEEIEELRQTILSVTPEDRRMCALGCMEDLENIHDLMQKLVTTSKGLLAPEGILNPDIFMVAAAALTDHKKRPPQFYSALALFAVCKTHGFTIPRASMARVMVEMSPAAKELMLALHETIHPNEVPPQR